MTKVIELSQQDVAEKLLFSLFRSLDSDYKKKYLKNIWEQFESNVRQAAYTSKLSKFLENITSQIPIVPMQKYGADIAGVIGSGMDKTVLTWLRDETTYLLLLTRMLNEKRKAEFQELEEDDETFLTDKLFDDENS